jgi:hypothetical protein
MTTILSDLVADFKGNDRIIIRFDGVDYLINRYYMERGEIVLETGRLNEDDGSDVTEDDIV